MNPLSTLENAGIYTGIENRICEIREKIDFDEDFRITGKFLYLTFRNRAPSEAEFAKFIYDKITRYCIPREKFQKAFEQAISTRDERYINDLHDQAKNLFVKSINERGAQLGEPGELIAFIVLEAFFNAPQIACKMYLKTSEKMPIHGSDSVHIRMSEDGERLELFWGEAKLYGNITIAMDRALDSISEFINGKEDQEDPRAPRDRDIDIIKDHPNVSSNEMEAALLKYFDPYEKESNNWKEVFFCMVGFDFDLYNKLQNIDDAELHDYFQAKYIDRIKSACKLFEKKIKEKKMTDLEFALVLLPFKNLDGFRSEFQRKLGMKSEK